MIPHPSATSCLPRASPKTLACVLHSRTVRSGCAQATATCIWPTAPASAPRVAPLLPIGRFVGLWPLLVLPASLSGCAADSMMNCLPVQGAVIEWVLTTPDQPLTTLSGQAYVVSRLQPQLNSWA